MANVLIVEDHQPAATAQAYRLWESGHTVAFAGDGRAALEQFHKQSFDVVLLDYELPDTTGLELYRRLRQIDPSTSVVMVTGRGDERLAAQILKEGAKDYLTKSGGLLELLPDVVQRVLKERETQRLLAAQEAALKRAHEELEQKVAQRTAELKETNQRLEQEIDYRRRVEKTLLQTNRDMLAILDSVSDGFVSLDGSGQITYINRVARDWLAPDCGDAIGARFLEAFPWTSGAGLEDKLREAAAGGRPQPVEIEVDSDDLHDWIELRLYPRPDGVAVQFRITTERKARETRREKQRQLLSRRVQERTAELAAVNRKLQAEIDERLQIEAALTRSNTELGQILDALQRSQTQMLQAEKMASLGQLAAGVAHEINNPAGFVSSNLHTLAEYHGDLHCFMAAFVRIRDNLMAPDTQALLPEELCEGLAEMTALETRLDLTYIMSDMGNLIQETREGTDRIQRIVADLKAAVHPGREELMDTDLNDVIDSAVNLVRPDCQERIDIQCEFGVLPAFAAYPQRLHQLFRNLLVNAVQAIEAKGAITIRTKTEAGRAVVDICDDGVGISPAHLNKVFDPFFTTKPVGQGTGLGLKMVYDITQNHGGAISVESTEGVGTTFTLRLPLGGAAVDRQNAS